MIDQNLTVAQTRQDQVLIEKKENDDFLLCKVNETEGTSTDREKKNEICAIFLLCKLEHQPTEVLPTKKLFDVYQLHKKHLDWRFQSIMSYY